MIFVFQRRPEHFLDLLNLLIQLDLSAWMKKRLHSYCDYTTDCTYYYQNQKANNRNSKKYSFPLQVPNSKQTRTHYLRHISAVTSPGMAGACYLYRQCVSL
jgi:hypothetical protein